MKKRLCALSLALCLTLCGCGSMFHRGYSSVEPHTQNFAAEQDPSILAAETYQELLSAILFFVSQHADTGTVRLYNYTGVAEADLAQACLEVVQEDPLGSFCIETIDHSVDRIVSYYETHLNFTYRRTPEEIAALVPVIGNSAIKTELRQALFTLEDTILLRIVYFAENTALEELFDQAYYDTPLSAFGRPEVSVQLYPETGRQRIAEIRLTYSEDPIVLLQKQTELIQAVTELLPNGTPLEPEQIYDLILGHANYLPSPDHNTAYAALVSGNANDEGMALAYKLLCDRIGLSCTVVRGSNALGEPRFWNIVSTSSGSRHVDCSQTLFGLTDTQLTERGDYQWPESYPICRAGTEILRNS